MDTDPTPVCPLFSRYVHILKAVRVQRCFFDFRDARGDPNEDRSFILGEEQREQPHYQY